MKHFIQLFLIIIILSCSFTKQSDTKDTFQLFINKNRIDWKTVEIKISDNEKNEIAQKLKNQFSYFFEQSQYDSIKYGMSEFAKCLHYIDINNDYNIDVIYEGFSGGESDNTQIFINKNGKFTKVIEVYQYIETLNFDRNGKFTSFTALDFGCCADYIETETKFAVNENFKTSILYQRAKPTFIYLPQKKLYEKPINFTTINDENNLRSRPIIDDTSTVIYDAIGKGNTIGIYPKHSLGKAWTEFHDSTGQIWYFVEMNPVEKLKYNLVYKRDSISPSVIGWINKRYLQIENE